MKKIMILNGSPRRTGNTAALIEAFARGAQEAGNEVTSFFLNGMNIHGCLGCFGGGKDPASPCVQKDDMLKIYPAYREADVVVLATPLYYWTVSGQLKTAFDRLFAVAECDPDYRNPQKESVLLMAAEGNGFEETVYWYDRLMGASRLDGPRQSAVWRRDGCRRHQGQGRTCPRIRTGKIHLIFI